MHISLRSVLEHTAVAGIVVLLVLLALGSWRPVRVTGWSMHPALHPGDVVLVHKTRQVEVGEIVLFKSSGHGSVLHRAIGVDRGGKVRTRGDANWVADREALSPSEIIGPVRAVAPIGRVITRWRGADTCATMTVQTNSAKR